jgi:hypothetical protein
VIDREREKVISVMFFVVYTIHLLWCTSQKPSCGVTAVTQLYTTVTDERDILLIERERVIQRDRERETERETERGMGEF